MAPSNLIVMGGVGQAQLNWTDNASNETGFTRIERKLLRTPTPASPWSIPLAPT